MTLLGGSIGPLVPRGATTWYKKVTGTGETTVKAPDSGKRIILISHLTSNDGSDLHQISYYFGSGNQESETKAISFTLPADSGLCAQNMVMIEKWGDIGETLFFKRISAGTANIYANAWYLQV